LPLALAIHLTEHASQEHLWLKILLATILTTVPRVMFAMVLELARGPILLRILLAKMATFVPRLILVTELEVASLEHPSSVLMQLPADSLKLAILLPVAKLVIRQMKEEAAVTL